MPNHVETEIMLEGPAADIATLLHLVGAFRNPPEFDCGAVFPYPEPFASMDAEFRKFATIASCYPDDRHSPAFLAYVEKWKTESNGYNNGGQEWCVTHWGTKWGCYDVTAPRTYEGQTRLTFHSAWSTCRPVLLELSKRFAVAIHVEAFDGAGGWANGCTLVGGIVSDEWTAAYAGPRGS